MQKDLYDTEEVLSVTEDNVIVKFPNKTRIVIPSSEFDPTTLDSLREKHYCGGCANLSSKGYNGTKDSWCKVSRTVANYTNF